MFRDVILLLILIGATASCSYTSNRPTGAEERTRSAKFDGEWVGTIVSDRQYQMYTGVHYTCALYTVPLRIFVEAGEARVRARYSENYAVNLAAYVTEHGAFRAERFLNRSFVSDSVGEDVRVRYLIDGFFDSENMTAQGEVMMADAKRHRGCVADFSLRHASHNSRLKPAAGPGLG